MPDISFDDLIPKADADKGAKGKEEPKKAADVSFDDLIPEKPGYAADIAKSLSIGGVQGVLGMAGAPWDIAQIAAKKGLALGDTIRQAIGLDPLPKDAYDQLDNAPGTSAYTRKKIEGVTGPFYQPKTVPGEYARTLGEFAASAPVIEGGLPLRIAQTAIPAFASEAAGQYTKGSALEPYARGLAAVAGGGVVSGAHALANPRTAQSTISEALQGVDQATVGRAQALMQQAEQQGVTLTWDEAIAAANGGATRLTDVRGVVENLQGGQPIKDVMNNRPGQIQQAGDAAIGQLAPTQLPPTQTGLRAQAAAGQEIAGEQANINAQTRPLYQSVENVQIHPQQQAALMADPLYAQTLAEVRNDPALNRTIAHLPDDAVGVVDLVQRRMREASENARMPGQANTSNLRATNIGDARTGALQAAENATGGATGPYAQARQTQANLRQNVLEPLNQGPLGQVSRTADVQAQGNALLPSAPAPNSAAEVADTVTRLVGRDPVAVENVIHSQVRGVFNEQTQALTAGENAFGGAKFAAAIAGNTQQAQNLEAAIRALPNGAARWDGFQRFLEVARATGRAPRAGSPTAPKQVIQEGLKGGGAGRGVLKAITSAGTAIPRQVGEFFERLSMNRNSGEIARILTDPRAGRLLAELARTPPNTARAGQLSRNIVLIASASGARAANGGQSR
jgi:hypothetical protein